MNIHDLYLAVVGGLTLIIWVVAMSTLDWRLIMQTASRGWSNVWPIASGMTVLLWGCFSMVWLIAKLFHLPV